MVSVDIWKPHWYIRCGCHEVLSRLIHFHQQKAPHVHSVGILQLPERSELLESVSQSVKDYIYLSSMHGIISIYLRSIFGPIFPPKYAWGSYLPFTIKILMVKYNHLGIREGQIWLSLYTSKADMTLYVYFRGKCDLNLVHTSKTLLSQKIL